MVPGDDDAERRWVEEIEAQLAAEEERVSELYAHGAPTEAAAAARRVAELRDLLAVLRDRHRVAAELAEARELLAAERDPDMRDWLDAEIDEKATQAKRIEQRLAELLSPPDRHAGRPVIVEIRGAEGGEEANLWAADLWRMYQRYAERRGWQTETLEVAPSEQGGVREVTFVVKGPDAWARLRHEAGPHRVQRVPATEHQGRIHTSAATVAVLPEADEQEVTLRPADLDVDVFRATGPGGQSVNTTDSAVRVTHRPSGLVVTCQDSKSQHQNKERALRILRARLAEQQRRRQARETADARRAQVRGGGRAEKVRTYNFKENRVTDHRIGLTMHALDRVLAGDLDPIVDALVAAERARQLREGAAV
jgi:peptide chain release factor 1